MAIRLLSSESINGALTLTGNLTGTSATFAGSVNITGGTTNGLNITTSGTQDTIKIDRAATSDNAITKYQTGSADKWIVGLRNTGDDNFRFYSYGRSSDVLTINQTNGNASFAGHIAVEDGNNFYGANAIAASSEDGNYVASFGKSTSGSAKFAGNITVGAGNSTFGGVVTVNNPAISPAITAISSWSGTTRNPQIKFARIASAVAGEIGYSDPETNLYIGSTTNHDFRIRVNNNDIITCDTAQNVGIGTTSPFANATTNTGLNVDTGGHSSLLIGDGINDGGMIQSSDNSQRIIIGANVYDSPTGSWSRWNATGAALIDVYGEANSAFISLNVDDGTSGFPPARLFIDGTGYVGIGTTSPVQPLTVAGNVLFRTTTTDGFENRFQFIPGGSGDPGNFYVYNDTETPKVRLNGGGDSYLVGGDVGIGETSPSQKLNVREDGGSDVFRGIEVHNNNQSLARAGISFQCYDWVQSAIWHGRSTTAAYGGALVLGTNPNTSDLSVSGVTGRMWILNSGNVGIGINTPEQKLHVEGRGIFDGGNSSDILQIRNDNGGGVFGMTSNLFALDLASTSAFRIRQGSSVPFYLKSDGNVGIGTTNPTLPLSVNGPASMGDGERLSMGILDINSGGTPSQVKILTNIPWVSTAADFTVKIEGFIYGNATAVSLLVCWHYYNSEPWNKNCLSNGSWAPTITMGASNGAGGGFVEIHLSSPGYWPKFYVKSVYSSAYKDAYSDGWSWSDAALSGTTYAVPYKAINDGTSSDYRLKEDLKDFAGLDMVSKIPVYNFKWKDGESRSYGVMAHELQEVLPEAVEGEKDEPIMQWVDYRKVVPLLVKSIQELKAEIEILKSK